MDSEKFIELSREFASLSDPIDQINKMVDMTMEVRNYNAERAMEMSNEIIARSQQENYKTGLGRAYNLKAWCYWQQGNYEEGLKILNLAEKIALEVNDTSLRARIYNNFGHIYRDTGHLGSALSFMENALALNIQLNDIAAQAVNMSSIAYIHYDLGDYDTALEYAVKALPALKSSGNIHRLNLLNNILGNIYFKKLELERALAFYEENLQHSDTSTGMYALAMNGIGKVNFRLGNIEKARYYLQMGLKNADETGHIEVQISCRFYLALIEISLNNFLVGEKILLQSLELSGQFKRRHDEMSIHEELSNLYDKMGNIPKAFEHLKTFEKLKEEIFTKTTLNKLSSLKYKQEIELANKEKEVAEKTAQLKQQFLANMSHEIRTPMNAIVGITKLLIDKEPRPDQLKYLSAISQSADNLLVIINDILDIAKIEAGKMTIEETRFSLQELLEGIEGMLKIKADEKGIMLNTRIYPEIPDKLMGDPTRLQQILINLVGNAIKFTEKGRVLLNVSEIESGGKKHLLRFDIIDTGIGIAEEHLSKMFESFTQASSDTTRKFGGTGLGLAISKQLTELMKGSIAVTSEPGTGSCFTVTIPFAAATEQEEATETQKVSNADIEKLKQQKILLAEDNEFNQLVAIDTIQSLVPGIDIEIAENGREALEKLEEKDFDIILMDIRMPQMDGMEATKAIRQLPGKKSQTKIIAMTANVMEEDVKTYFRIGINAYISKPFERNDLLNKMIAVMNNQTDKLATPATSGTNNSTRVIPDIVTDMSFLRQFTRDDHNKQSKYINMFLENAPKLLGQLQTGLANKDYGMIKIAAHSLKPQLSYMGIPEDISHVFLLEQSAGEKAHYQVIPELVQHIELVCKKAFEELGKYIAQ